MRGSIVEFGPMGVYMTRRRRRFTVAYGDILTAERLVSGRGLRLHTLAAEPVVVRCRGSARIATENEFRRRGVRIVDEYGAMITPTLQDFETELSRDPAHLRQSYDNA